MFEWSDVYILRETITYRTRYGKDITAPEGFHCDGASGIACDIDSRSWKFHDWMYYYGRFDDGSRISFNQAQVILKDILEEEGRWFRAMSWYVACRYSRGSRKAWADKREKEMCMQNYKFMMMHADVTTPAPDPE